MAAKVPTWLQLSYPNYCHRINEALAVIWNNDTSSKTKICLKKTRAMGGEYNQSRKPQTNLLLDSVFHGLGCVWIHLQGVILRGEANFGEKCEGEEDPLRAGPLTSKRLSEILIEPRGAPCQPSWQLYTHTHTHTLPINEYIYIHKYVYWVSYWNMEKSIDILKYITLLF